MEGYLTYYYEYHFLYITGIDHVESKSIQGAALMKLVFHRRHRHGQAMAQTVGYVNRARAFMPPGTVPPFHHALRRRQRRRGTTGLQQRTAHRRAKCRIWRSTACARLFATLPGVSAPPPVRRQPAHHRHHARSRQAASISHLAGGGHRRRQQSDIRDAVRQYVDRQDRAHRPHQRRAGRQSCRTAEHAHPAGFRHHGLPARYRHHRKRHRPGHRVRARQRQTHRVHPRHQTRRRFHALGHQRREGRHPGFQKNQCPTISMCAWSSINRPTSPTSLRGAGLSKACWARRSPA